MLAKQVMLCVIWSQGKKYGLCKRKPAKSRRKCLIIKKEHPWVEFDSGAFFQPVTLNIWQIQVLQLL